MLGSESSRPGYKGRLPETLSTVLAPVAQDVPGKLGAGDNYLATKGTSARSSHHLRLQPRSQGRVS